ncbi:20572_t:CDS:2 [Rhizophagus irregularis]|nr:20572_t:CDS:2 [Rhizophagus irregularis]
MYTRSHTTTIGLEAKEANKINACSHPSADAELNDKRGALTSPYYYDDDKKKDKRDTDTLADGDKYDRIVTISTTMARTDRDKRNDKDTSYYYYYHDHKNVKKDHEVKFYRRDADASADRNKHDKDSYYFYNDHKNGKKYHEDDQK